MKSFFSFLTAVSSAALGATVALNATPAHAAFAPVRFGYDCVTFNSALDCAIAQSQIRTTVSQGSALDEVVFTFRNIAPSATAVNDPGLPGADPVAITSIYFEDTAPLLTLGQFVRFDYSGLTSGQQVNYRIGSSPNRPPGLGNSFQVYFSASPTAPRSHNGVGVGESLGLIFKIRSGFRDPINAVITDLQRGGLRTAVHTQAYASGGSETLVNGEVPEPLTILGSGAAIAGGAVLKRRAANKKNKSSKAAVS